MSRFSEVLLPDSNTVFELLSRQARALQHTARSCTGVLLGAVSTFVFSLRQSKWTVHGVEVSIAVPGALIVAGLASKLTERLAVRSLSKKLEASQKKAFSE